MKTLRLPPFTLLVSLWLLLLNSLRADVFVFEWWLLTGDFSTAPVLDLDGDPVPQKVWAAFGEVTGTDIGDFPLTTAWLEANYGEAQGYAEPTVTFDFGSADTGAPPAFVLDPASFSNNPADGTARMTYLPAGGAANVAASFSVGGIDSGGNRDLSVAVDAYITELKLEMNPALGWSGYGTFYFVANNPNTGPVTGTEDPLFEEVAAILGGGGPFRSPITIGGFEEDPVAFAEWQASHPTGQISDAAIFSANGGGYVGERSGVTQDPTDVKLPGNARLVERDGDYYFEPKDLDELGRWFDPPMVEEYGYRTLDGSYFSAVELPVGLDTIDGKFTLWFDGTSTEVPEGVFFSFRDHHVGGGNLVNSFRITGIGPAVDAADPEAFPVRLAFWDGSAPIKSARFAIRPAIDYQPDALVAAKSSVAAAKGDNLYNRTGAGQSLKVVSRGGKGVRVYLGLQNDGEGDDRIRLRGTAGNRGLKVAYTSGGNRTTEVTRGRFRSTPLDPGDFDVVRIDLKPLSAKVRKKLSLLSTSASDATKSDLAKVLFSR
jgi:hypothetical protein